MIVGGYVALDHDQALVAVSIGHRDALDAVAAPLDAAPELPR
jgi:hypothetical protein